MKVTNLPCPHCGATLAVPVGGLTEKPVVCPRCGRSSARESLLNRIIEATVALPFAAVAVVVWIVVAYLGWTAFAEAIWAVEPMVYLIALAGFNLIVTIKVFPGLTHLIAKREMYSLEK